MPVPLARAAPARRAPAPSVCAAPAKHAPELLLLAGVAPAQRARAASPPSPPALFEVLVPQAPKVAPSAPPEALDVPLLATPEAHTRFVPAAPMLKRHGVHVPLAGAASARRAPAAAPSVRGPPEPLAPAVLLLAEDAEAQRARDASPPALLGALVPQALEVPPSAPPWALVRPEPVASPQVPHAPPAPPPALHGERAPRVLAALHTPHAVGAGDDAEPRVGGHGDGGGTGKPGTHGGVGCGGAPRRFPSGDGKGDGDGDGDAPQVAGSAQARGP